MCWTNVNQQHKLSGCVPNGPGPTGAGVHTNRAHRPVPGGVGQTGSNLHGLNVCLLPAALVGDISSRQEMIHGPGHFLTT